VGVGGTLGDDNKLLSTNGLLRLTHYKGGTYDLYHIYFVYLFTCVKDCLHVVVVFFLLKGNSESYVKFHLRILSDYYSYCNNYDNTIVDCSLEACVVFIFYKFCVAIAI